MTEPVGTDEPSAGPARPGRLTSRPVTLTILLLGGLLAVVATAQPWWRAAGGGAQVSFKGTEATTGLSQALAVVTLAGTLLVLVLRAAGRRVVAVLLGAVGVAIALVGALRLRPGGDAVRTKMREVSLIDQYALSATLWPWVFAAAGVVVVVGAAALLRGAPHWTSSATRFERPTSESGHPAALAEASEDPTALWKALDAGIDPTSWPAHGQEDPPPHPDVHLEEARDTMVANTDHNPSARQQSDRSEPDHPASAGRPTQSPDRG